MYHSVYFHKATRGIQHLMKDMLHEIIGRHHADPAFKDLGLMRFFQNKGTLADYEALDDSSVLVVAHIASEKELGLASDLAKRFLRRDNYKCLEIPSTATGNIGRNKLEKFRTALRNENIYFIEDIISHRSYKQHEVTDSGFLKNILIKKDGEIESLGSVSLLLTEPAPRVARIYFRSESDRDRAQAIFRGL
jgi:HD superfamily phosphohydrolase